MLFASDDTFLPLGRAVREEHGMDLLIPADLVQLSQHDEAVHLSLFMPTHRFGRGVEADQIRWKNTLTAVDGVLADRGMRRPDVDSLLAPAWRLHRDAMAWQYMSDGLAVFLSPEWQQTLRVPVDLPELATVGDRFVVGPLLPILGDEHFLAVTVSQRQVRLLEVTRYRVEEVMLGDVPGSLRDVVTPAEPRSDTMAWSTSPAGRGGPAVFYGHGAADEHFKKDEIERFLRQVAAGLDDYLAGQDLPLVLIGLDYLVSTYRDITRYPHVLDEDVRTNPDQLDPDALHEAAWPVIAQRLAADKQRVVDRFEELHGTGRASTDPAKIEAASADGRIDTLLVTTSPSCWEQAGAESPRVLQLGADETFAHCERLDRAAVDTLTQGGHIYAFSKTTVPGGGDVAAVFRY
jgi:hypothetical protein